MTAVVLLACLGMLYYLYCIFTMDEAGNVQPTKFDLLVAWMIASALFPFLWLWEKFYDRRV